MSTAKVLQYMFPDEDPRVSWIVENDGTREKIAEWHLITPQPTVTEMEANEAAADVWWEKKLAKEKLAEWDREGDTGRMAEDCMDILIAKGLITADDFPSQGNYDAVVAKINKRKAKRQEAQ